MKDPSKKLEWKRRITILRQVAEALEFLHLGSISEEDERPKILHRDIKSANILLDENDNARLSDVGLARFSQQEQAATAVHTQTTTMRRGAAGTHGYVDPQYLSSLEYTPASDIYSFGVVMLELLTGRTAVLPGTTPPQLLALVLPRQVGRISSGIVSHVETGVPPAAAIRLYELALQCLKLDFLADAPTAPEVASQLRRMEQEFVKIEPATTNDLPAVLECRVCMSAARGCKFLPCHHSLTCLVCGEELKRRKLRCPACRAEIRSVQEGVFAMTFVPN